MKRQGSVVAYTYNSQSQQITMTDQRGCVHQYVYDLLGRLMNDCVTTLGSGVDGTVLQLALSYEVRGLLSELTSYNSATVGSGTIVNDVQLVYNSFGQLVSDTQSHSGAAGSGTPQVQYGYLDGSTNVIRPTTLTYPNGRVLTIDYGTSAGIDDSANLVNRLIDTDSTTLVNYSYLGLNQAVQVTYPQPSTQYTLLGSSSGNNPVTGDIYWGLDLFGRIVDSRWFNTSTNVDVDRIGYGYDQNSNRIWRQNPVATALSAAFDEYYTNDGLNRLKDMQRGTLNGTETGITSPTFAQCWTLDPTGNWMGFNEAASGGTWTLSQARAANTVNEITGITTATGTAWAVPAYDASGNMTSIPEPANPGELYTGTYDAWNRLVQLVDATTSEPVQQNQYDARNFRTAILSYTGGTLSETRHCYYTSNWQDIEERIGTSTTMDCQFVWGVRYIDDLVVRDRSSDRFYALQDANWNVTSLVNTSGAVQERYAYSAYGVPTFQSASFGILSASSYSWVTLYCAYRYDAATGLYLVRYRAYQPDLGIWCQRDPAGYSSGDNLPGADGIETILAHGAVSKLITGRPHAPEGARNEVSLYAYVGNKPLAYVDPDGLKALLGSLGSTLAGTTTSEKCKNEAIRIGKAIQNTFTNNRQWFAFPRLHDERNKGHYCYEWAYGFEDAFNLESSGDCFNVVVQSASTASGNVHYWIAITPKNNPTNVIYVDDGFVDGDYVHKKQPIPLGWEIGNPGDVPRNTCTVPSAYNCRNYIGKVRHVD